MMHHAIDYKMNKKHEIIKKGFVLAGLMNILGVLVFSRLFRNTVISEYDMQAMSNFGLLMIVIWGFAFISVCKTYYKLKWLVFVFVIEKLIYATHWTKWISSNNVSDVFAKDKMAGIFFAIYGINDWLFFGFFLIVFVHLVRTNGVAADLDKR